MSNIHFFEIPVYRVTEERFYEDRDKFVKQTMYPEEPYSSIDREEFYKNNPHEEFNFRTHIEDSYGAWDYNDVIGWLQLYFIGDQIRGAYWGVKGKRIMRSKNKAYVLKSEKLAAEMLVPCDATNTEIFDVVKDYVKACRKELKRRYIDTSRLETIGPFVDWRSLLNTA